MLRESRKNIGDIMETVQGTSKVCAHRVKWSYFGNEHIDIGEITEEIRERLESGAEERAKEQIIEDYVQGELNTVIVMDDKDYEVRGWWKIEG